ncbi:MAG: hypothetical protein JW810_12090 [Sedimentisphaerales bacterium]|nr:hypothetical protein [Sedimentisphaerales bacterium]
MGKLLLTIALAILLANGLAILGLLGYGLATGRMDAAQRAQYLATWQGQSLVPPPPEAETVEQKETPQQASARIAAMEIQREVLTREIERDMELARSMQNTVDEARKKMEGDLRRLVDDQQVFETKLSQYNAEAQSEGFQKSLKAYANMKPKTAKDDLMKMTDQEAVRYLSAMKPDVATQILEQFRTPEEQTKRLQLMQMLEKQRVISLKPPQSDTEG